MSSRRNSRICALELLYQGEFLGMETGELIANRLEAASGGDEEYNPVKADNYSLELFNGIKKHKKELDLLIDRYAKDWKIERMPLVDLNILRISLYEIMFGAETPVNVSINEAVELAKLYGSEDSSRFINGVLGKITRENIFKKGEKGARQTKKL